MNMTGFPQKVTSSPTPSYNQLLVLSFSLCIAYRSSPLLRPFHLPVSILSAAVRPLSIANILLTLLHFTSMHLPLLPLTSSPQPSLLTWIILVLQLPTPSMHCLSGISWSLHCITPTSAALSLLTSRPTKCSGRNRVSWLFGQMSEHS